ncbi:sensor histidine kinase [Sphingomicrobium flavum]|uniref:sensor histidine kinase n=1 Tax=Sphingomicrobium flavum TaxID=1229164 RepID=UPI0021ADFE5C|nr:ATP-binding protein [Sphingomicrobium flavum]
MKRFTLATQVALIVALALFIAQAVSFTLSLQNRQHHLVNNAALPAAQRLLTASYNVDAIAERPRMARQARMRLQVSDMSPLPPSAERIVDAEKIIADVFAAEGIPIRNVEVAAIDPERRKRVTTMIAAVQLADGRWLSVRGRGPMPMRPLLGVLILQYLIIGLLILLPTLWLLRRTGRSLRHVTRAAESFDGTTLSKPVPIEGPRDVRALIAAVNGMETRIAAMVEEKDVMLGAIGHDLRTPLTALRIEAETIEEVDKREALIAQIETLHAQFEALLDLARSARSFGEDQWLGPVGLIQKLLSDYHRRGKDVALTTHVESAFEGDEGAIRRAIVNLIDNGLRFGTKVELAVRETLGEVIIEVADDGPGIPEAQREQAMRPFERLESSRNRATGGHGLGLAIVSAIARRHGGRLVLDSGPNGAGLIARIHIPVKRLS